MSGLTALASQVIWTRLLSLVFGASVYTFSLILAVFLAGLGIGSAAGAALGTRRDPRVALGWCQLLLCGAMAGAGHLIAGWLPYLPNEAIADPWARFQLDLWRCLPVVLPGAILWGASFPLALAAAAKPGQDPGRLVGGVYAANTAGAIVGALAASLIMVSVLGTQHAQQLLILVSILSGLVLLTPRLSGVRPAAIARVLAAAALVGFAAWRVPPIPGSLAAYRPVLRHVERCGDDPVRRRGAERLHRRLARPDRRAQLPRRRQGAGVERRRGHAPAAHARPLLAPHAGAAAQRARDWARRGRHGRRRLRSGPASSG